MVISSATVEKALKPYGFHHGWHLVAELESNGGADAYGPSNIGYVILTALPQGSDSLSFC